MALLALALGGRHDTLRDPPPLRLPSVEADTRMTAS